MTVSEKIEPEASDNQIELELLTNTGYLILNFRTKPVIQSLWFSKNKIYSKISCINVTDDLEEANKKLNNELDDVIGQFDWYQGLLIFTCFLLQNRQIKTLKSYVIKFQIQNFVLTRTYFIIFQCHKFI